MGIGIITFGGHGYYPHFLISSIMDIEKDVFVAAPENLKREILEIHGEDPRFFFFNKPRMRYPTNLLMLRSLLKKIEDFKPDVVHMTGYYPWVYFSLKRLSKFPLVLTVHDPIKHSGDIPSKVVPGSDRWFFKHLSQIVVLGDEMKRNITLHGGIDESKVNVIPHGNYNKYRTYLNPEVREKGSKVLFFGRVLRYKGLEYLARAEPIVSEQIPDVEFVIAGTGSGNYLDKVKEEMVHPQRFTFLNEYIPNEAVAKLFQECSLVVLPYVDGTQSGPLLLSYAFKKPVVITNVGSLPEYVDDGHTGYVVPPKNPQKLAEKIIALLKNDQLRKEMGENGFNMSSERFSWEKLAGQYLDVYQKAQFFPEQ